MTLREKMQMVESFIGSSSQFDSIEDRNERIKANATHEKMKNKMVKIIDKYDISSFTYTDNGRTKYGTTAKGDNWVWDGNNGMEMRSRYCGTLTIKGETIFTSGSIEKALEYILNN